MGREWGPNETTGGESGGGGGEVMNVRIHTDTKTRKCFVVGPLGPQYPESKRR